MKTAIRTTHKVDIDEAERAKVRCTKAARQLVRRKQLLGVIAVLIVLVVVSVFGVATYTTMSSYALRMFIGVFLAAFFAAGLSFGLSFMEASELTVSKPIPAALFEHLRLLVFGLVHQKRQCLRYNPADFPAGSKRAERRAIEKQRKIDEKEPTHGLCPSCSKKGVKVWRANGGTGMIVIRECKYCLWNECITPLEFERRRSQQIGSKT